MLRLQAWRWWLGTGSGGLVEGEASAGSPAGPCSTAGGARCPDAGTRRKGETASRANRSRRLEGRRGSRRRAIAASVGRRAGPRHPGGAGGIARGDRGRGCSAVRGQRVRADDTIDEISAAARSPADLLPRSSADKEEPSSAEDEARCWCPIDQTLDDAPGDQPVLDLAGARPPLGRGQRRRPGPPPGPGAGLIAATPALQARPLARPCALGSGHCGRLVARARAAWRPWAWSQRSPAPSSRPRPTKRWHPRPRPGPARPGRRQLCCLGRPD